jgi:uncharacterized membrane protein
MRSRATAIVALLVLCLFYLLFDPRLRNQVSGTGKYQTVAGGTW